MKIYSERFPLKYLFANEGICLGVDTKKSSYLLLVCKHGIIFRKRPVGDTVVESLDYRIYDIYDSIAGSE